MTLKNAAFLAMLGTLVLTVLLAVDCIRMLTGALGGFIPAMSLLRSLIYLFASLTVTVFFWTFGGKQ